MILLVTNSRDLPVDSIVKGLKTRGVDFVRLDLDLLSDDRIYLDPINRVLKYRRDSAEELEVRNPQSVLFRAPTHLRESSGHRYPPEVLLKRHQWAAFARSLAIFSDARWINHPGATYSAENKPFQLSRAAELGFKIPNTVVANDLPPDFKSLEGFVVKALDSFFVRSGSSDLFFYTKVFQPEDLPREKCAEMPLTFQDYLEPKIDVRVTVVGNRCFTAEAERPISGDWRLQKEDLRFRRGELGNGLQEMCVELVRRLNLVYGAIDLAHTADGDYFLEINPTGEWGWLDDLFDGAISDSIVEELLIG